MNAKSVLTLNLLVGMEQILLCDYSQHLITSKSKLLPMPVCPHQPANSMVLHNSQTHHTQPVQLELLDKPQTCKRVE